MNMLRRLVLVLAFGLLPILLFAFGFSFSLERVFGGPNDLKYALSESGVYQTAVDHFLAQDGKKSGEEGANNIPISDPAIKDAVAKSFPPNTLRPQLEHALDNTYAWLRGDVADLRFSFDLRANQHMLADNLGAYAKEKATALPVCPADRPITSEFDAFNAPCRPVSVTPEMAAEHTRQKLLENEFFKNSSIAPADLKDKTGRSLGDRFQQAPKLYQVIRQAIWGLGIAAVILGIAAVSLSRPWREGALRLAFTLLSVGCITTLLAWFSTIVTGKAIESISKSSSAANDFQKSVADMLYMLASDIRSWWIGYGILLIILSVALFLILKVIKEKEIIDHNLQTPPENRPHVVVN